MNTSANVRINSIKKYHKFAQNLVIPLFYDII